MIKDSKYDALVAATEEAMRDPKIGDCFTEMWSFWVFVVDVGQGSVTTLESGAPCSFPEDGTVRTFATREEFRAHYAYRADMPGYWVKLDSRGHNVAGWLAAAKSAVTR